MRRYVVAAATNPHWDSLSSRFTRLHGTRRRVDALVLSGQMSRLAADQMYEALFLSGFTAFEVFLEEVFLYLLVAPHRGHARADAIPRLVIRSLMVAREVVIGPGRKYADWLPFERTLGRAELFFRGGRPFSDVPKAQRDVVDSAQLIRHAIAHHSRHSEAQFLSKVVAGIPLPPREQRPGGFLRGVTGTPPATRFETYAATLQAVAKIIS